MKGSITSLVRKRKGKLRYSIGYILLLFISFGCSGVNETVSHQNDDVYYAEKGASIDTADTNEYRDSGKVDYYDKETAEQLEYERLMRRNSREWLYRDDNYYNNDTYWRIRGTLIEDEEYYDPTNDTYQPNDNSSGSYDDDKDKRDREIDGSDNKRRR